jgi:hypothetical protein
MDQKTQELAVLTQASELAGQMLVWQTDQWQELHTRESFEWVAALEMERRVQTDWTARRNRRWLRRKHVAELEWGLVVEPIDCQAEWVERELPIDCLADK